MKLVGQGPNTLPSGWSVPEESCATDVHADMLPCRLVSLKNTISKQLPNMPKEYIARLVMDRRHRSCAIVAKNGTVLGGITYRPFHAQVCHHCPQPALDASIMDSSLPISGPGIWTWKLGVPLI